MLSKKFKDSSISLKEEVKNVSLKQESLKKLEKSQIPLPKKPQISLYKEFPKDITEVPKGELGGYIGIYEAEAAWISYCISQRKIDLRYARILLGYVYNKTMAIFSKDRNKVTEVKNLVESDDFYVSCKMDVEEINSEISMLQTSLEACERYGKAISREITNRKDSSESFPSGRITGPFDE